jgi:phosphatidylserine/phosphatidylglycerophosphate/cardiolipin synthase-like enzyme
MNKLSILFCSCFGYLLLLNSCTKTPKKLPPLPQDPQIKVYFNHNQSQGKEYLETYRNISRTGDNLEAIIIEEINKATKTIDIAVQELNLTNLARAIVNKQKAGIKIRIILENKYNNSINQLPNNHGLSILKNNNIPIIDDTEDGSKGSGLMHHKFIVIDQQKVITGSANFTLSDIHGDFNNQETRGNANHLLVIDKTEIAQIFTEEFNYLWGDGISGKKDSVFGVKKPTRNTETIFLDNSHITIKFSPNSRSQSWENTSNGLISKTLTKANQSIDLALFVFSDQGIANSMEQESLQGVQIRALIDPNFAYQYYSEGLDLLGVALSNKCRYEAGNNPWTKPITTVGISNLPQGDKLHHKFAIIDNQLVITGSHNWSNSANNINDETLLIIDSPVVTQHFQREFDYLYQDAQLGIPDAIQSKIAQEKQQCS